METTAHWRRSVVVGLLVCGVIGVHAAWACVPQPRLVAVLPDSSGPPGTEVTIDGLGFDPGRAEVRWNSREGEVLATANGPDFSVTITVPEAPAGLYALVVLSRQPGGAIGNTARAAFQVTGPDGTEEAPSVATTTATTKAQSASPANQESSSSTSSLDALYAGGLLAAGGVAGVVGTAVAQRARRRRTAEVS